MLNNDLEKVRYTTIAKENSLSGEFIFHGHVRVNGKVEGKISFQDNQGHLVIEPEGHFKGETSCQSIEIYGHFKGHLKSSGKVIIYPSANVEGVIESEDLCIYPGSQVNIEGKTH